MTELSENQLAYLQKHAAGDAVAGALNDLLLHDSYLLTSDANERSITFRFAMHLQARLPEWTVDCEYNRDGVAPKRIAFLGLYADAEDEEARTVFPDIVVHRRGTRENYLVMEFKKSTSQVSKEIDIRKLAEYRRQLGYVHALFVEVATDEQSGVSDLEWVQI